VETFVSFLQAVESPYEVHDYVKNYLGEDKTAKEFARQFLEKRSHLKNKARNEKRQEEVNQHFHGHVVFQSSCISCVASW
jgi:PERQ amino acid-rich with GYF domain-containing protein